MSSGKRTLRSRHELGQSLVEFAFVLPIFLLIIMAIVDFGWAFRGYIVTTNAAREGARWAVIGAEADGDEGVIARTVDRSSGVLTTSQVKTFCDDVESDLKRCASGSSVRVEISYEYHYITPLGGILNFVTGGVMPDPLRIKSSTTMRHE
ncbi:MAG: TadE/TadG family type IV pilus assembly protein [Dehalococcoidia bacterium]